MSLAVQCRCGNVFACDNEDRGTQVYCPSCGLACLVEEASEKEAAPRSEPLAEAASPADFLQDRAPAARGRVSVFGSVYNASLARHVVQKVVCLCGAETSVRLEELGGVVYCTSCGAELATEIAFGTRPDAPPTPLPLPEPKRSPFRSPLGLFTMTAAIGVVLWISQATSSPTPPVRRSGVVWIPPPTGTGTGGEPAPFDPVRLSGDMIENLGLDPEPFRGLTTALGWRCGLEEHQIAIADERYTALDRVAHRILDERTDEMLAQISGLMEDPRSDRAYASAETWQRVLDAYEVPADDPRYLALAEALPALLERADAISLEMIEALATEPDPLDALIQAGLWLEELERRSAPEDDPRSARLREIIADCERRLTPEPEGPAKCIGEFRQLLDRLRGYLETRQLQLAAKAIAEAAQLLADHPDDLGPFAKRLYSLKDKFEKLRQRDEGVAGISELFKRSDETLRAAEQARDAKQDERAIVLVSEALEHQARARLMAFRSRLRPAEIEDLERTLQRLKPRLQLARGWRQVLLAEQAHAAHDLSARQWCATRALATLPGLPEPEIAEWIKRANAGGKKVKSSGGPHANTDVGKAAVVREMSDDLWEQYAIANATAMLTPAVAVADLGYADGATFSRIGGMFFDLFEPLVSDYLDRADQLSPTESHSTLSSLLDSLRRAAPWQVDPRWLALEASLKASGKQLTERALVEAERLVADDDLEAALELLDRTKTLATLDQTDQIRERAQAVRDEMHLRSDHQAEEDAWKAIRGNARAQGKIIEAVQGLREFLRRYPDGLHAEQAKQLMAQLESDAMDQEFESRLRETLQALKAERFADARRQWPTLAQEKPPAQLSALWHEVETQVVQLKQRAAAELLRLAGPAKLLKVEDVLEIRDRLPSILEMDPDNVDAQKLQKRFQPMPAKWAKKMLNNAKILRRNRSANYKVLAETVIQLDADGPYGKEAKALLESGDAAGPAPAKRASTNRKKSTT